uniref:Uncharacterized LOC107704184 n=1 Tax=Sinocyclocheilus anshuiensis TaxID=1608454 RepID=A0A671PKD7_9TELE
MIVLGLITCVVLRAFSAQAKVVHSFNECDEFFYLGTEPSGMDQNAEKICQKLENGGLHYATLYSVHHKIPLYSAYKLDARCLGDTERKDIWHLEPQVTMSLIQKTFFRNQPISSYYRGTGYDRGHLNPSCFQCGDGRKATFTLTNAAPMDACFNRKHWRNWERTLKGYLIKKLLRYFESTTFIVTGTVPDPNVWIPQRETSKDPERVSVPSHVWTAVCYKRYRNDSKSLSFGFIGRNQQKEPDIRLMSVSDLNDQLSRLYSELSRTPQSIKIFADDCFGDNNKLTKVMEVFPKLINLQVNKADQMSSGMRDTYLAVKRTFSSDGTPEKKVNVNENTGKMSFDSMSTYYKVAEDVNVFTGSTCLITYAKPQVRKMDDERRKREVSAGPDAVECQLVPEKQKTAADGSRCSSVTESDDSCQCNTGGETKPCCSSPCFIDKSSSYWCYSGQTLEWCSPPYSLITYNGKRCLDDHPCATYGEDYYWCWTSKSWDYCSPPLKYSKTKKGTYCRSNHACAKYGYRHTWCYTDDKGNYDKCCTSDDCYSTVNDQTCRSNHLCGYHDKAYLWCYTDREGNWDYCCTNCRQWMV